MDKAMPCEPFVGTESAVPVGCGGSGDWICAVLAAMVGAPMIVGGRDGAATGMGMTFARGVFWLGN